MFCYSAYVWDNISTVVYHCGQNYCGTFDRCRCIFIRRRTSSVSMKFTSLCLGIAIGSGIVVSQFYGANDEKGTASVIRNGTIITILSTFIISINRICAMCLMWRIPAFAVLPRNWNRGRWRLPLLRHGSDRAYLRCCRWRGAGSTASVTSLMWPWRALWATE